MHTTGVHGAGLRDGVAEQVLACRICFAYAELSSMTDRSKEPSAIFPAGDLARREGQ
jgi:hypothetical protein